VNSQDKGRFTADLNRTLVYAGAVKENELAVYWVMAPEKVLSQNAGTYRGKIKYTVESSRGNEEFVIDLECYVQPVFTIAVNMPPEGLNFNKILPNGPPEERSVDVIVQSNLHKPYQVVQGLSTAMTNEKGAQIDNQYLTMKLELPAGQKGQPKFIDFTPVKNNEYPVYISDAQGSPVSFKVIYKLQGYPGMRAGNFMAPVRFTLQEN
ncbi:MAG: hypothetical protein WCI27_10355, partial [Candidatus Omnitrophota bacterium]